MKKIFTIISICLFIALISLTIPACAPTYTREGLPEAVKTICKAEYDMDVNVSVEGSTIGIYYPMEGLLDAGFGISTDAWDTISNLLLIASRVVLSTDANIQFYCVVAQDARLPELQVVIIKYVDDVKRGMFRNISRGESFKRTLFSFNLTPQAKKERSIEDVFEKMGVEEGTRQNILDEFFRSPPAKLSDIGHWKGNFYLKDISKEEFIAAQLANRVKADFRGEKDLAEMFDYLIAEGSFVDDGTSRSILLQFKIADQTAGKSPQKLRARKIKEIVRTANEMVYGYKFKNFDYLILEDQLENVRLTISGQDVYDFSKKKLTVEEITQRPPEYF